MSKASKMKEEMDVERVIKHIDRLIAQGTVENTVQLENVIGSRNEIRRHKMYTGFRWLLQK